MLKYFIVAEKVSNPRTKAQRKLNSRTLSSPSHPSDASCLSATGAVIDLEFDIAQLRTESQAARTGQLSREAKESGGFFPSIVKNNPAKFQKQTLPTPPSSPSALVHSTEIRLRPRSTLASSPFPFLSSPAADICGASPPMKPKQPAGRQARGHLDEERESGRVRSTARRPQPEVCPHWRVVGGARPRGRRDPRLRRSQSKTHFSLDKQHS